MSTPIQLRVITDAGIAVQEEAVSVVAPGEVGYLGILRNHAPLVTTLGTGTLRWKQPGGQQRRLQLSGGLLEISHNRLTVLTAAVTDTHEEGSHR